MGGNDSLFQQFLQEAYEQGLLIKEEEKPVDVYVLKVFYFTWYSPKNRKSLVKLIELAKNTFGIGPNSFYQRFKDLSIPSRLLDESLSGEATWKKNIVSKEPVTFLLNYVKDVVEA